MSKNQNQEPTLDDMMRDLPEPELLEPGTHGVRVIKADVRTSRNGNSYINLFVEPLEHPNAEAFGGILMLPKQGSTHRQYNQNLRNLQNMADQVGIAREGLKPSDLAQACAGHTLWVRVGVETQEPFGTRNKITGIPKAE